MFTFPSVMATNRPNANANQGDEPMATKENPAQPLFSLARAVIDECDKQAERWLEYGIAQTGDAAKIARTLFNSGRAQALSAGRTMLETVENLARSMS
jgi:DNA-binding transcriptional regulator LsrR (DeoR family)